MRPDIKLEAQAVLGCAMLIVAIVAIFSVIWSLLKATAVIKFLLS